MRAWLMVSKSGIDCEEIYIPLFSEAYKEKILAYSPAGKVPVYVDGGQAIWDSLAIGEYLAEQHPSLWPESGAQRAHARSISAEMHSGFAALRQAMPMNCRANGRKITMSDAVAEDIKRVQAIWTHCRRENKKQGPWLFGAFGIADAMYAPVVSRFHTYGVACDGAGEEYMQTVLGDAAVKQWYEASAREKEIIERVEVGAA